MAVGKLVVRAFVDNIAQPVAFANVEVLGEDINVLTDEDGQTEVIELFAPDIDYSLTPQDSVQPFATYDITVSKLGLTPVTVTGVEIYPGITSYQDVFLKSTDETNDTEDIIDIDYPTLWGEYSPKLPDEEQTNVVRPKVLPRVYIPEYVIVHDGIPSNTNAANYYVSFTDYIKNVASSEVYPTWPEETLKANIIAIISFALNRIYTEWYRSKGYNFTITSTPAYDQKYTPNRTIFDTISNIVDEVFTQYIRFPGRREPYLAHYNDGINVNNPGWLSQWGSKELGDRGYTAEQILKYYYGSTLLIDEAPIIEDYPTSFPGYNLSLGSCGEEVQKIQSELNYIRGSYPGIPIITNPNGVFDSQTENAVRTFQKVFSLPVTGIIDFATWYKISYIFVAVSKMTEAKYK